MYSVTKKRCPYCLGEFRGANGLAIHLSRSTSCSAQQNENIRVQEETTSSVGNAFTFLDDIATVPYDRLDLINHVLADEDFVAGQNEIITVSDDSSEPHVFSEFQLATGSVQVTPPFDTNLELVYLMMSLNKGNGLSKNDQNKVLRFLQDPRVRLSDIKVSNATDIEKFMANFEKITFGEEARFLSLLLMKKKFLL